MAIGTNTAATLAMLTAKADSGATGENALIVNCRDADYIIGPIGIIVADSLHGEISPKMSTAIGQSKAKKILLPISHCNVHIIGTSEGIPLVDSIKLIIQQIK